MQKACKLPKQTVGNCSWKSLEPAVWALLVHLKALEKTTCDKEEFKKIVKTETKRFQSWLVFNQLYNIERYANIHFLRDLPITEKVSYKKKRCLQKDRKSVV